MPPRRPYGRLAVGLSVAIASFALSVNARAAPPASAAYGAPLDRLSPAPAGDAFFSVASADVSGQQKVALTLGWSFASAPLTLRSTGGASKEVDWVSRQMILHTLASYELFERFKFEIDLPFTLNQGGSSGSLGSVTAVSPSGASINDVRLGIRALVLRQIGYFPAAALALSVWAPTGDPATFTGAGAARAEPAVILSGTYSHWEWTTSIGRRFLHDAPTSLINSQFTFGAAAAARFGPLRVGPEVFVSGGAGDRKPDFVRSTVGAELMIGAHYAFPHVTVGLAGGPGFGSAPGTPRYRLLASVGADFDFHRASPAPSSAGAAAGPGGPAPLVVPDRPGGSSSSAEAVIAADRDGDTVPDAEDACPTIVGDPSPNAARRGCPSDRDRDGVYDIDDACPDEAGAPSADPAKNGCPLDTDGDTIPDSKDACPNEKGKPNDDPKLNGCPTKVRVEGAQIVILVQVNFETGKDEIKKESFDLLEQVAAVLKDHPEIARVAVDGHTDNVGSEAANITLSQRRSLSVIRWLIDHGIDARRLEARGFGPRRPIADNKTDAGKAKNRRVEFLIRRRSPDGEAGWRDGPVE